MSDVLSQYEQAVQYMHDMAGPASHPTVLSGKVASTTGANAAKKHAQFVRFLKQGPTEEGNLRAIHLAVVGLLSIAQKRTT